MVLRMYKKILGFIFLFSLLLVCLFLFDPHFLFHISHRARDAPRAAVETKRQYGVIIDGGSSGSRLFIYTWPPHSGRPGDLLEMTPLLDSKGQPIVKKVNPGLSALASRPDTAASYIRPLLELAAQSVPRHQHKETPFYLMATAGMRVITSEAQTAILDNIRRFVRGNSDFLFSDSHAKVISGEEEGIFGWIATNYLLGRFTHNHTDGVPMVAVPSADSSRFRSDGQQHHRKRTVGTIDMGGGSMQIAYELVPGPSGAAPPNSDSRVISFNLGCRDSDVEHTYKVFVTTFLGFGANSARDRYERVLLQDHLKEANNLVAHGNVTGRNESSAAVTVVLEDPCLHRGLQLTEQVKLVNDSQGGLNLSTQQLAAAPSKRVTFAGTGKYHLCEARLMALLDKQPCPAGTVGGVCTMSGRLHPPVDLANTFFYGFSEFWYSSQDVLGLGGPYNYFRVHSKSVDHCNKDWVSLALAFKQGAFRHADWDRLRYQCFKSAWISGVLHGGLAFPSAFSQLVSVQEIGGAEVQWSLGALLFQTRYFPLRAIEQTELVLRRQAREKRTRSHSALVYMLLLLAATGALATMCWMHWCRRGPLAASLHYRVWKRAAGSFWSPQSSPPITGCHGDDDDCVVVAMGCNGNDSAVVVGGFSKHHSRSTPNFQFRDTRPP